MLIILAKRGDETAAWLADRWRRHDAVLVSPADLSRSGWNLHLASPGKSTTRIGRRDVRNDEIDGVVTRIPCVEADDLHHIVPSDRQYVASEMTAFLLVWLSSLACPILNHPTPNSLGGPGWRPEQWTQLASRLGIRVTPVQRKTPDYTTHSAEKSGCEVTVIGEACFGDVTEPLITKARKLAKAAGATLLSVHFKGSDANSAFVRASVWPDLASPGIADAVLHCLSGKAVC